MTLDLSTVRRQLGDDYTIEHHAEVDSTNSLALQRARDGVESGLLISADYQSAGRGQRGAVWTAPPGSSVLCSLLLRTKAPLPSHHLAILTGVGAANGLNALDIPAKIKWPNDLFVHDRKVAGMLVETIGDAVVIGFGVNCAIAHEEFPAELRERAGSLHALTGRTVARETVLASVARGVIDAFASVEAGGIIKVLYAWNKLNWFSRRKVRVTGPMGVVEGDGLFLDGRKLIFHVFKDYGVVPMPLSSKVEAR